MHKPNRTLGIFLEFYLLNVQSIALYYLTNVPQNFTKLHLTQIQHLYEYNQSNELLSSRRVCRSFPMNSFNTLLMLLLLWSGRRNGRVGGGWWPGSSRDGRRVDARLVRSRHRAHDDHRLVRATAQRLHQRHERRVRLARGGLHGVVRPVDLLTY